MFSLDPQKPQYWAWISRMMLHVQSRGNLDFKPSPELKRNMESYLENLFSKKSDHNNYQWPPQKLIFEKIDSLTDYVWELNRNLLLTLGCEIWNESLYQEEKLMQIYFTSLFYPKRDSNCSNTQDLDPNHFHMHAFEGKKIENLMSTLFFSKTSQSEIYHSKHTNSLTSTDAVITEESIILTALAVNIIGNYYKNYNNKKWVILFETDQDFFEFLIQISKQKYLITKYLACSKEMAKQFKPLKLFPWRMDFSQSKIAPDKSELRRYMHYRKISMINHWMKKIDENTPEPPLI
jgi:hypothetical protein